MTSDQENCGLTSFLPMSCRGRAEHFARSLHSRLQSLGSQEDISSETTWLGTNGNALSVNQPRHSYSDPELLLDIGFLEPEPPGSPEELEPNDLEVLINIEHKHKEDCHCTKKVPYTNGFNYTNGFDANYSNSNTSHPESENSTETDEYFSSQENDDAVSINDEDISCKSSYQENANDVFVSSLNVENNLTVECPKKLEALQNNTNYIVELQKDVCDHNVIELNADEVEIITQHNVDTVCKNEKAEEEISNNPEQIEEEPPQSETKGLRTDYSFNDEDDEDFVPIPRLRRCSSLKTGKTPPGTPGRKKIVRFADVLGLDLADVKTFVDEIPKVPTSAYNDLTDFDVNDFMGTTNRIADPTKFNGLKLDKTLFPLFQQPGDQPNFLDKVRDNFVCLESAMVDDPVSLSIKGTVRVRNMDFHKSAYIRYTLDGWKNFSDVQAHYVEDSCDGFSDKFTFLIYAHTLGVGQRLEFAVRFQTKGCQFWDNNSGINYCFNCLPPSTNALVPHHNVSSVDQWSASFY